MLIEREDQLESLRALTREVGPGRGRIALVYGEAGVGKSALVQRLRAKTAPGLDWSFGGCEALFTPRPLGPVHDMAATFGPDFTQLLQSGAERQAVFFALRDLLSAAERPRVLVWEDLHWADHATLDLLNFLGRRIAFLNVLIVATFRDDELEASHPLRQVIGDLPTEATVRIALQPLSREAVGQLARDAGISETELFAATSGNPFLVKEMIAARRALKTGLPPSVRDAVDARHQRLSPDLRKLLEALSVIPGSVSLARAQTLAPSGGAELISEGLARGILTTNAMGAISFRHELARQATFERLTAPQRRDLHILSLEKLKAADPLQHLDEIVHHAAGALSASDVLEFAPLAAARAAQAGAHREAAAHLGTARRFIEAAGTEQAARLHEQWAYESGLAERIDDDVLEARRTALTLWRALGRTDKVGENLSALSGLHWYRGEAAEAARYADQAIATLEATPPSIARGWAYSLRSRLHMLNDHMDEAVEWGLRALEIERAFPAPDLRAHALNNIGTSRVFRGHTEGLAQLQESLETALAHGLHEHAARVYTNLSEYAVDFRDFALAEKTLSDGIAFDSEHDLHAWTHYLSGRLALLRLDQGRLKDAETISQGVLDRERLTLLMRLPALQVLSRARLRRGAADARALVLKALGDAMATEELQHILPCQIAVLEAAYLFDEPRFAANVMDSLGFVPPGAGHPWIMGERAIWFDRMGESFPGSWRLDLPQPFLLELDGNYDGAADAWDALGLPYAAALARARLNDAAGLSAAMQTLQAIGARAGVTLVKRRAAALGLTDKLSGARRGAYRGAREHLLGLTLREQEVARLMVRGQSNREISQALDCSPRTVEHHVSSVLAKFGATNRMGVMLRVQAEPWLLPELSGA